MYLSGGEVRPGEIRRVQITQASDYDLVGELVDIVDSVDETAAVMPPPPRRVGLRVLQTDGR